MRHPVHKPLAIFLSLGLMLGFSCSAVRASDTKETAPLPPPLASITCIGMERSAKGIVEYRFRVTNTSRRILFYEARASYHGFPVPNYDVQFYRWFQWREDPVMKCGTGLFLHHLKPGGSFTFLTYRESERWCWRVGVELFLDTEGKSTTEIWSDAVR